MCQSVRPRQSILDSGEQNINARVINFIVTRTTQHAGENVTRGGGSTLDLRLVCRKRGNPLSVNTVVQWWEKEL